MASTAVCQPLWVLPLLLDLSQGRGREVGLRQECPVGSAGSDETAVPAATLLVLSPPGPGTVPFPLPPRPALIQKGACHTHAGFNNSQAGHTHRPQACRAVVQQRKPRCARECLDKEGRGRQDPRRLFEPGLLCMGGRFPRGLQSCPAVGI